VGPFQSVLRLVGQRCLTCHDVNGQELAEVGRFVPRLIAITVNLLAGVSDGLEVGKDLGFCQGVAPSTILPQLERTNT
jgi:hypothetical protein